MALLEPHEAEALRLRYIDGMGLESIGLKLGTGRHGASGVIARALRKLRALLPEH
jgi:DNA-directed RNA polymerase specialized sigma24 family protein